MSETAKTYTEREMVLAQRAAWIACDMEFSCEALASTETIRNAAARYPLPKITRPRIVTDSRLAQWRVIDGSIQWQWKNGSRTWGPLNDDAMFVTHERLALLADLLANPTEEVEDDA